MTALPSRTERQVETTPSRSRVDRAGTTLVNDAASPEERREALAVVSDWRALHGTPLNDIEAHLRSHVVPFETSLAEELAFVAQRLKRLPSIEAKLRRSRTMRLSRMQDVAGCRAVLPSAADLLAANSDIEASFAPHELLRRYDYLAQPSTSGYRGTHLVYAYRPEDESHAIYSGLGVEVQLRSRLQHSWATAVETVGAFSGQALKSSEGSDRWLRFFALMGTVLAKLEDLPPVPKTPTSASALRRELAQAATELDAVARLDAYSRMLRILEGHVRNGQARYFHIYLEVLPDSARLRWNEYAPDERAEAIRAYEEVESAIQRFPGAETVLVAVDSVAALRRAYPNYFADTRMFAAELKKAIC